MTQKDNSTFRQKAALRRRALGWIDDPLVLETHAGSGKLYRACYSDLPFGVAVERDERKTDLLAEQRPAWAVYQGDSESALAAGLAADWPISFLDLDPYGEPWPVLDAFFESERERPARLVVVVNDGLRQKLAIAAWDVESMRGVVERYGNKSVYARYLDVARELMIEKAAGAGYRLDRFEGYYCGHGQQMTHYAAVLSSP